MTSDAAGANKPAGITANPRGTASNFGDGNPDLGKPPEQLALEREIAELAAQGREEERGAAADRLAAMITKRVFGS